MDKRIGYVHFSKGSNADQPCACSYKNGDPCHWKGDECERVAFVDSDELAKLEADAVKVPGLEAAIAKKDEAIRTLLSQYCGLCNVKLHSCSANHKHPTCDKAEVRHLADKALSLTPGAVAKEAESLPSIDDIIGIYPPGTKTAYDHEKEDEEYARIGRAVEDWLAQPGKYTFDLTADQATIFEQIATYLDDLNKVIARAREGEGK